MFYTVYDLIKLFLLSPVNVSTGIWRESECMKDIRERHKVVKVKGKVWKSVEKSESEFKAVGGMNNPQTVGEW